MDDLVANYFAIRLYLGMEPIHGSLLGLLDSQGGPALADFIEMRREQLGVSQRQLCAGAGIQRKTYQRLLDGEAQKVDLFTVLSIARFLNVDDVEIIRAFEAGSTKEEAVQLSRARRTGFIHANFDLHNLRRIGFLESASDTDRAEARIKEFFGLDSILQYGGKPLSLPMFKRSEVSVSDKMLDFWLRAVTHLFEKIKNPYPFDEAYLRRILPKLPALTMDESNGFRRAIAELYRAGVTVVFQSYLGSTKVYGGTFMIKGRPCVVVTDLWKRYPTLWHSLIHELYHVLKDRDDIERDGLHLTTEGPYSLFTMQASEGLADRFAAQLLCSDEKLAHAKDFISMPAMITTRAYEWGVHAKMIYGRYLKEFESDDNWRKYSRFVALDPSTVRDLRIDLWTKESLDAAVVEIQEKYHLPA